MSKRFNQGNYCPKLFMHLLLGMVFASSVLPRIEGKVFMCYWASWSHYRTGEGRFSVDSIDPNLCTHLIYSFATINDQVFQVESFDPNLDHGPEDNPVGVEGKEPNFVVKSVFDNRRSLEMILQDSTGSRKTVALKTRNPNLKVLLAVGGAGLSPKVFSDMAANPTNRKLFIDSVVKTITTFGFDGIDIDWEYPNIDGLFPVDKSNFVELLKELNTAFLRIQPQPLLTAAIGAGPETMVYAYDFGGMIQYLDYFNVMAYDFKAYRNEHPHNQIGHHSPLFTSQVDLPGNENFTVDASITYIRNEIGGTNFDKIILGIGAYGRTYTLESPNKHNFYNEASGLGVPYKYTNESGIIAYFELCLNLVGTPGWEEDFEDDYKVPYAFNDTQWIGYDDAWSAIHKVNYADEKNLGGMMLWSLDLDDCNNYCGGWESNCHIAQIIKDRWMYLSGSRNDPTASPEEATDATDINTNAFTGPPDEDDKKLYGN